MNPHAIITGTGLVSPLGKDVNTTWRALLAGEYIRDHARVSVDANDPRPRVTQLASRAAREAIAAAGWSETILADDRTALIVGTSKGPIEIWMTAPPSHISSNPYLAGRQSFFGLHQIAESLAEELRLGSGPRLTLSAACATGLHALIRATMLIQSNEADRVLVVAAEASVHPLFAGSFKRLGVLPPEGFGCRPFDQDRSGFLMSEAAAAVCLERPDHLARPMGRAIYPRIDRFALGADATHLTGLDPSAETLRRLLRQVINDRPIDLIHAHGTGTPMNDPIELAAINDSLSARQQDRPPRLYSHKGALGHTLGAAGLVSIVLNVESHRHGIVPPNVQTRRPLDAGRVILSQQSQPTAIRRSIAVAAGFGGPIAVISLENP